MTDDDSRVAGRLDQHDEQGDEVEGHLRIAQNEEAGDDGDDEVEAHKHASPREY